MITRKAEVYLITVTITTYLLVSPTLEPCVLINNMTLCNPQMEQSHCLSR